MTNFLLVDEALYQGGHLGTIRNVSIVIFKGFQADLAALGFRLIIEKHYR